VIALVATVRGTFALDLETGEVGPAEEFEPEAEPELNLPRVVAAAAAGATVVAVVDAKPPLLVSHDAGVTWRQSGRGLPAGRAVAVFDEQPDVAVYAARNRLYLTRDGGVFWTALAVELPEILAVSLRG
jgi:photosystem II stability/assembly factor-like uncharacterized protein